MFMNTNSKFEGDLNYSYKQHFPELAYCKILIHTVSNEIVSQPLDYSVQTNLLLLCLGKILQYSHTICQTTLLIFQY